MIRRVAVTNYLGIAAREIDIPPAGGVIEGRNRAGKTSLLKAIRAALAGQGIDEGAIRQGADAAEILVDLDEHTVRRVITRAGAQLRVTDTATGRPVPAGGAFLAALLGASPLDPLDLLACSPADRRKRILDALPIRVTMDQIDRWIGKELREQLAITPRELDGVHGLIVLEDVRGRVAKLATSASKRLERWTGEAEVARRKLPAGVAVPETEEAGRLHAAAQARLLELRAAATVAREHEAKTAATRARVVGLRQDAANLRAEAPKAPHAELVEASCRCVDAAHAEVERLRGDLIRAERAYEQAREQFKHINDTADGARWAEERARQMDAQAADLEASLSSVEAPTGETVEAAAKASEEAAAALAMAKLRDDAEMCKAKEKETREEAEALGVVVRRLRVDAPAELAKGEGTIEGLTIEDGAVLLDGKPLDDLSGAEQIEIAVEIARRANTKGKLLIVDGLERLDPEELPRFIAAATRDGYQVIATRVASGDARLAPLGGGS